MSDRFSASDLSTAPRPHPSTPPARATPNEASHTRREESFERPTIAEGLVMLLDLYRDLLALAVWRRLGARFPKEAHELNSPAYR